jgi:hypothetical protein
MGRIYEERGAREELRWYCSFFGILAKPSDVRTDGRAPTLEAAKADFEASWRKWLAWAKLGEIQQVAGGHGQKTTRATINRARQTNHDAISGSAVAGNR